MIVSKFSGPTASVILIFDVKYSRLIRGNAGGQINHPLNPLCGVDSATLFFPFIS